MLFSREGVCVTVNSGQEKTQFARGKLGCYTCLVMARQEGLFLSFEDPLGLQSNHEFLIGGHDEDPGGG